MTELAKRPGAGTPPALLFIIGALLFGVIVADLLSQLGLALWVPLRACLFSRSPLLPPQNVLGAWLA